MVILLEIDYSDWWAILRCHNRWCSNQLFTVVKIIKLEKDPSCSTAAATTQ